MNSVHGKIPAHLPKRLTIAFIIWGLMDTSPEGRYHDLDQVVKECVERGFNCIRLEDGAGLTHDLDGNRRPPADILRPYGEFSANRQLWFAGGEGKCDYLQRLIDLCEACKKYDVYLILSSWYFLHTYWYSSNEQNQSIFSIPPRERYMAFAKFLHYILKELEERGLSDRIAFAEIFNEANGLSFVSDETAEIYKKDHEEALEWLYQQHPNLLFAFDGTTQHGKEFAHVPDNMQVYNMHNYFLWSVYGTTLEQSNEPHIDIMRGEHTVEDVIQTRKGRFPENDGVGWYPRALAGSDLDLNKLPEMEAELERQLNKKWDEYLYWLEEACDGFKMIAEKFPDVPLVSGEGVTYCAHQKALWEEKSERYWEMVRHVRKRYKECGLWGAVIKTCCGPEDPSWELCKDKLRELNEEFLND